jgi:hypothetical protein
MIYHVSYASDNMSISLDKCRASALRYGCDATINVDIDPDFAAHNRHILSQPRGAGYWLWKPYVIHRALFCKYIIRDEDYIVYTDAGVELVTNINRIIDEMERNGEDIFLFGNHYQHRDWCKREVFDALNCKDGHQVQASAMVLKNSENAMYLVEEWLDQCQYGNQINDILESEQYPGFREHRHDQAILTAVAQAMGLKLHWWPAMYNGGAFVYDKGIYTDDYPIIFHHHRKRNDEW